jgi:hypothetical protein
LIIITRKETTKARTTWCSSLPQLRVSPVGDLVSTVESASAAYFGIIVAPHEYFDQTTTLMNALQRNGDACGRIFGERHPELKESAFPQLLM